VRGDFGVITLVRTNTGWCARFSGQIGETVQQAFGTTTIPTAFTSEAPAGKVVRAVAAQWKDCDVRLEAGQ
jgi:hypothetical protein